MNLMDLKNELEKLNISKNAYSLTGGLPNESYCIGHNNGKWEVYYSERGNKSGLKTFDNEDFACDHFIDLVKHLRK